MVSLSQALMLGILKRTVMDRILVKYVYTLLIDKGTARADPSKMANFLRDQNG